MQKKTDEFKIDRKTTASFACINTKHINIISFLRFISVFFFFFYSVSISISSKFTCLLTHTFVFLTHTHVSMCPENSCTSLSSRPKNVVQWRSSGDDQSFMRIGSQSTQRYIQLEVQRIGNGIS